MTEPLDRVAILRRELEDAKSQQADVFQRTCGACTLLGSEQFPLYWKLRTKISDVRDMLYELNPDWEESNG